MVKEDLTLESFFLGSKPITKKDAVAPMPPTNLTAEVVQQSKQYDSLTHMPPPKDMAIYSAAIALSIGAIYLVNRMYKKSEDNK
ncbi:hypothetical protein GOV05_05370 [Candidatus Woesearchaeota archaeon]|nr:hypothetical protein [Candidatus Woesearchaeota archaeon]